MVTMYFASLRSQAELGLIDSAFTKCIRLNPTDLDRIKVQIHYHRKSPRVSNPLKYCSFIKNVPAVVVLSVTTKNSAKYNLCEHEILLQGGDISVYQGHHTFTTLEN